MGKIFDSVYPKLLNILNIVLHVTHVQMYAHSYF